MKYEIPTYETFYSDGGHGGPHADFASAYAHSLAYVRGLKNQAVAVTVEIRPPNSEAIGGFRAKNRQSFYLTSQIIT